MKKTNPYNHAFLVLMLLMCMCLGFSAVLNGAVIYVATTEDNVEGSLRWAITTAAGNNEADTIHVPSGTYVLTGDPDEDANAYGDLDIDSQHPITIIGNGKGSTFIEGNGKDRVFHIISGTVSISDITMQFGGFQCGLTTSPYNTTDDLNLEHGGAIHNNGTLTLKNCTITGNNAKDGCYLLIGTGWGCSNGSNGGGIYNTGILTMEDCTVANNESGNRGSTGLGPTPAGQGGGIYSDGTLNMLRCRVTENLTGYSSNGAGIYNKGAMKLEKCTISGNISGDGTGCRHCDTGTGGGNGGGIFNLGTNCTIIDCTIENNETGIGGQGDALYGVAGSGAGICNCGTITLENTSVINNVTGIGNSYNYQFVGGGGGGFFNTSVGNASLHNCTISGNSTGNGVEDVAGQGIGGYGGGICNNGKLTLKSCTIVNNKTGQGESPLGADGGGIYNADTAECHITNTIIAGNTVSPDRSGPDGWGELISNGYNLIANISAVTISGNTTGNLLGVDPLTTPLADNGGPTRTHALQMTSPAVDAGTAAGLTTDQRGRARPTDMAGITNALDGSDIGAFEVHTAYSVSGRITHNGIGLEGVALAFSNGAGTAYTNATGYYFHSAAASWWGTVTPSKEDYTFTPTTRTYTTVIPAPVNQDYTAAAHAVSVTITNPHDGDTVAGLVTITAGVSSQAADSTPQSVTRVEFHIDGELMEEVTAAPFQYDWDTGKAANGSHTIKVKAYNAAGQSGEDEITVTIGNSPRIVLNRTELNFMCLRYGADTMGQEFTISNGGTGDLNWALSDNQNWLRYSPESGTDSAAVTVKAEYVREFKAGTYVEYITVSCPEADNSPQKVKVTLKVVDGTKGEPPFGKFQTPLNDATVMSSVPFTGWVLDDVELQSVQIYREPVQGEPEGLIFVGDCVRVEGARPDIEQRYPDYPDNYRAGWGYMMLTNFLPNEGNGYFTFHVIAIDWEGHKVTLGTKQVFCDNKNADKPFGTLDTPGQGNTVSGNEYRNFGWALTPQPNTIPKDGSTITVWVDGEPVGHPVYNNYRDDIYHLFPGYNNSDGAIGYFYLDTTAYGDGAHTIAWSVEDDAGNVDGIGSRYFTTQNSAARNKASGFEDISNIPIDNSLPLFFRRGFDRQVNPAARETVRGNTTVKIKELERVELCLGDQYAAQTGYQMIGKQIRPLPVGSTLNSETGIFSWQPGPGFVGEYQLVFIVLAPGKKVIRRQLFIEIISKFSN